MMEMTLADFLSLPDAVKVRYIRDFAILYSQQFSREDLDAYCRLADACRFLHRQPGGANVMSQLLRHRMALNFFVQPSSRTFMSFNTAQAYLGMNRMSVRDVNISSISKGESLVDSVRTFISYVDLVVMRHSDENAGAAAFWTAMQAHRRLRIEEQDRPVPIISGGSGSQQHPTQALLDIYTLDKALEPIGGIDGKSFMLVGDLARGRTVRSLSYLMKNYRGVQLFFAAPERYQMRADLLEFLDRNEISWQMIGSISEAIDVVDAVYMTRIQDEYDHLATGKHVPATKEFVFTMNHLRRMKQTACLLHPLPKRDEIDPEVDYVEDPRVMYWRQERNGMWMRVAIIAKLFKVDGAILDAYESDEM
ncbi:MAG: aspartate carbamoyltransferase [Acidobacteriota bacterium]|nr:MAG: aspartate carbamoyltransferase [Acidobacteriota bacterium]